MIIKKCFVVAIMVVASTATQAQDSLTSSSLSVSVGLNSLANKDAFQSPYTYRRANLFFNSIYTLSRPKGMHIIDLSYSAGHMKSVVSPNADDQLILFNYDYLVNLRRRNTAPKWVPSLGVGVHTLLSNTDYLPKVELPKSYLSGGAYLTLSGNILYHLNEKNSLRLQVGVPVFGIVYRPDFEINGKTLTKTAFVGKSNLFSVKLEYSVKISAKINLMATYNYHYFTFDEPRPISILQNGVSIGLRKIF